MGLDDPQRLLEGKGKFVRHAKARNAADLPEWALAPMLRQALALGFCPVHTPVSRCDLLSGQTRDSTRAMSQLAGVSAGRWVSSSSAGLAAWAPRNTQDAPTPIPVRTLVYRLGAEQIEVIAVVHLRRRPDYWQRRS
ncbi:MAG: hypothetical protein ABIP94_20410 [Planctomycetota bacterium]